MASFLSEVKADSHLRIEKDFGGGFYKLHASEAERRQAAQDIRSSEDVLIELLRNSRDADAKNIFVATQTSDGTRNLVVIDDGQGVPEDMQTRIFEPRVTSKLNTAHMDKWGMHGRGMALYSVSVNSKSARVILSDKDRGTSIQIEIDLNTLGEKKDQSTFPHFEIIDGEIAMRGPKNLIRCASEFSIEHTNINVYLGSSAEILSTMYILGLRSLGSAEQAFRNNFGNCKICDIVAYASNPKELAAFSKMLGLDVSERSARRVMDNEIDTLVPLLEKIKSELPTNIRGTISKRKKSLSKHSIKFSEDDLTEFRASVQNAFQELASGYYIHAQDTPQINIYGSELKISIPFTADN